MHREIERHRAEIAELCRRYHVRRLDVFGSAAEEGEFEPECSDVDLLAEFETEEEPLRFAEYLKLRDALSEVLARPVDLVMAGSVRNPYVQAEIERTKEPVYAA